MKVTIVVGCIIAICILLVVPAVPAVEFNTIMKQNSQQIVDNIKKNNGIELKETSKNIVPKINQLGVIPLFWHNIERNQV